MLFLNHSKVTQILTHTKVFHCDLALKSFMKLIENRLSVLPEVIWSQSELWLERYDWIRYYWPDPIDHTMSRRSRKQARRKLPIMRSTNMVDRTIRPHPIDQHGRELAEKTTRRILPTWQSTKHVHSHPVSFTLLLTFLFSCWLFIFLSFGLEIPSKT